MRVAHLRCAMMVVLVLVVLVRVCIERHLMNGIWFEMFRGDLVAENQV